MQQANSQMDQPPATDHQQPTTSRSFLKHWWFVVGGLALTTAVAVAAMKVL